MQIITLYRYTREGGGITMSPIAPPDGTTYDLRYRLVVDEGKALTDGETITACADVSSADGWQEIDAPAEDANEATAEDFQAALEALRREVDILKGASKEDA